MEIIRIFIILVVIPFVFLFWLCHAVVMMFRILRFRRIHGISYLIVYSDSNQWKSYFENEVIPTFGERAYVINLSTNGEKRNRRNTDWCIYNHCSGGWKNRFPIVIRFSRIGTWSSVRFYDAFMQSKKGKNRELEKAKAIVKKWARP